MNDEQKKIKKEYGEEMVHLSREYPTILENEGLFLEILRAHFAPSHMLAKDIIDNNLQYEFKRLIYSYLKKDNEKIIKTDKTPFELMDLAGYTLYECKTESDIQSFKKYYKESELICTIYNGNRLNRCHVFFAVKKNVDDIKREDFKNPEREDLYGTSVISIQFDRGRNNYLSIKNRYNHAVDNPDSTFSNNLEKIIPGLTYSFEKMYGFNINNEVSLNEEFLLRCLNYVKKNKFYRFNMQVEGVYYCENNIIIDNGKLITEYSENKERYIIMDNYIMDLSKKDIYTINKKDDAFIKSIKDVGEIKKIEVLNNKEDKIINICYDDEKKVEIEIDKFNAIKSYKNNYVTKIGNSFLKYNKVLSKISIDNVRTIGDDFLFFNQNLRKISLLFVTKIGNNFLKYNKALESIYFPGLKEVEDNFLCENRNLGSISLPCLEKIGNAFMYYNRNVSSVFSPNVRVIGDAFFNFNTKISSISFPYVEKIGNDFLRCNMKIEQEDIYMPNVVYIGNGFLFWKQVHGSNSKSR